MVVIDVDVRVKGPPPMASYSEALRSTLYGRMRAMMVFLVGIAEGCELE